MATSKAKVNNGAGGFTKSEQAKKTEVIKEIHQIKIRLQTAESEKATRLYSKRSDFLRDFGQLQEIDQKIQADLKNERVRLVQQITKIKAQVRNFRRELQEVRPTPEFVEKLKMIMEDIEGQIGHFKEQQKIKYEELLNEERLTNQEVSALEQRFESWSSIPAIVIQKKNKPGPAPTSHRDITKDLPPEVASFERFMVESGGPRGGWDEYDHGTFLKYRNRHKGKASFLQEATRSLPTKTEEEVIQHERWYQEYLRLNDVKKSAIQRWKEEKEQAKEDVIDAVEEVDKEEKEKKLKEEAKKKIIEEERIARRRQLNAWKVEKELERAAEEESKMRRELEKAQAAERERHRQEQVRAQVLVMKSAREAEERDRKIEMDLVKQMEQEEKRRQGQEEMQRFQMRDLQKLKSKVEEKKAKEEAQKDKKRRMEQLRDQIGVQVERDPSRLLRPTKGWEERQKDHSVSGGPVLHMPHRAVPSWRAGLS